MEHDHPFVDSLMKAMADTCMDDHYKRSPFSKLIAITLIKTQPFFGKDYRKPKTVRFRRPCQPVSLTRQKSRQT